MKLILTYLKEAICLYPKLFGKVFVLAFINTLVQAIIPLAIKHFLDALSLQANQWLFLGVGIASYSVILLFVNLIDVLWYRALDDFGGNYILQLTLTLESQLAFTYGAEVDQVGRDKIYNIIYNDVLDAFRVIGHHSAALISSLAIVITAILITAFHNIVVAVLLSVGFLIGLLIANKTREILKEASETINSKMKTHSIICRDFSSQMDRVQSNNILGYYQAKTTEAIQDFIQTAKALDNKQVFYSNLLRHINSIFSLALFAFITINPQNTLVDLVFIMSISNIVIGNISKIDQLYFQILSSYGAFRQIDQLRKLPLKTGQKSLSRIESVEFTNVCFGYGDRAEYLLDNINFKFERGDCVKVIAPNGAGKSTMFKLLQGVYKPLSRDVKLNNQSLEVYEPTAVNQEIVYIGQNDGYITDSILNYLRVFTGKDISQEADPEALEIIKELDLHKTIQSEGNNISFGQRKRIQLATLFLRMESASVLILDEVDAGLDAAGTCLYKQKINDIIGKKEKIIFFVQHGSHTNINYNKTLAIGSQ